MTSVPLRRDELEHPSWCDAKACPMTAVAVGMPHQSRELRVMDGPRHVASVVLVQHATGPVRMSVTPEVFPVSAAGRVAAAMAEAASWVTPARR